MSTLPHCCDTSTLYLGLDSNCQQPALICTLHATHPNPTGIMHNIMPITHFKSKVNELKFHMSDKVSGLIEKYANFMDQLIAEVSELKVRKSIEMSTLWVRELAQTEEEYEHFKRIFRNDLQGFTCRQIANFYDKMLRGVDIKEKKLDDIDCYKEIDRCMEKLQNSAKARLLIVEKVADLEGVVQSGELLKRALPDRKILKENTRQILLQTHSAAQIDIRYNKATLKKGGVNFRSVFSKYSLITHTNYHLTINTKYTNILIGVCTQAVKQSKQSTDLHYNIHSLTYNCSNGCLYRDAMFQSGSAHLTKSKKNLQLILRINESEMFILMDKNVVCRAKLKQFAKNSLFLHILMRTEGDSFQIDSDKMNSFEPALQQQVPSTDSVMQAMEVQTESVKQVSLHSSLTIDKFMPLKASEQVQLGKKTSYKQLDASSSKKGEPEVIINKYNTFGEYTNNAMVELLKKPISENYPKQQINQPLQTNNNTHYLVRPSRTVRAQSVVNIETSLFASINDNNQLLMKRNKQEQKRSQNQLLPNPVVMTPIRKSQFEQYLKEESNMEWLPSIRIIGKKTSGAQQGGLKIAELQSSQSI